jgi:TPR repeat protein
MSRWYVLFLLSLANCSHPAPKVVASVAPVAAVADERCTEEDTSGCMDRCSKGDGDACYLLGYVLRGRQEYGAAFDLFLRGCKAGQACACTAVGVAAMSGQGVTRNPDLAFHALETACALKCENGCFAVGLAYEGGLGVEHDAAKAAQFYERSCTLGAAHGCRVFGAALLFGAGVTPDRARGIAMLQRGCDGGDEQACSMLKHVPPWIPGTDDSCSGESGSGTSF